MKQRSRMMGMAGLLVMALAAPAAATHTPPGEPFVPEYVETATYLHCNGSKIGNVSATSNGDRVAFDTTKPTASYTTGAGCGTFETFMGGVGNHNPIYDFPIRGTFTGNIKNITVRFWAVELAGSRALNEFTVDLHVVIDGVDILNRPTPDAGNATPAHAMAQGDPADPARLYEVTVRNIGFDSEADHTTEHEIEITAYSKYINGSGVNLWVYDTSEFDSGLVINDETMATAKVSRNT